MSKDEQQYGDANLRNVWTMATYSFKGAHFATFPPELLERCVKAGTSEKGCCVGLWEAVGAGGGEGLSDGPCRTRT